MAAHKIKPHQQAILDAFDAGEQNTQTLAEMFSYGRAGIRYLLKRYGRSPRSRREYSQTQEGRAHLAKMRAARSLQNLTTAEQARYRDMLRAAKAEIIATIERDRKLAA